MMGYRRLADCVHDLERTNQLVRISAPIDGYLEAAAIHRRVFQSGGPAILFENIKGCRFPAVSNLFGSMSRTEFIFRDTLESLRRLVELRIDPSRLAKEPFRYWRAPWTAWGMRPRQTRQAAALAHTATISDLPRITCWPKDGGPFITLPQVYSEDPDHPGLAHSNLGMYRVQLGGNAYEQDRQVGLHYQIHRGIGVHHTSAIRRGERLKVCISVGGPPSMAVAAVMPLPEGMSELGFAGALAGHRLPVVHSPEGILVPAEADFAIVGTIDPDRQLPEGPFGDHLGYYSLTHDFPVLNVERVYHRPNAIWPFTVVGRPPQEDTSFGAFIHELTGPIIPTVIPGVQAVHAVDAAGVHPLLLAVGSERYVPYESSRKPRELLTQAHAILGQGQLSLAKYLIIANAGDDPGLDIHRIDRFLQHVLERVDWSRDLHFQTKTTIDTLDYSGTALNEGSKLVIAASGPKRRELGTTLPADFVASADGTNPRVVLPGIIALKGPKHVSTNGDTEPALERLSLALGRESWWDSWPMVVLVDDSDFVAASLSNFLWVVFTRSNPAVDVVGAKASIHHKHYGCACPLIIDARSKAHHAPPLEEDPEVIRRIESLAVTGGPLAGLWKDA